MKKCPYCAEEIQDEAIVCRYCGRQLTNTQAASGASTASAPGEKTLEERQALLQREISSYVSRGFRVVSQTQITAQLVKPKKFSCLVAIICLILAVLPFILYLLYYLAKRDETVYLEVNPQGRIVSSGNSISSMPSVVGASTVKIGKLSVPLVVILVVVLCIICGLFNLFSQRTTPSTSVTDKTVAVETVSATPINTSEPTATLESYISLLNCTGSGGIQTNGERFIDFCLAKGLLLSDREKLKTTMREFCENKKTKFCDINTWTDKKNVPTSYPLTDSQLATQLAQYKKNETTGYDCFILYKNGEQVYASSGCSK